MQSLFHLSVLFLSTFDQEKVGHITEETFRKIMKAKVPVEDVEEMLEGKNNDKTSWG